MRTRLVVLVIVGAAAAVLIATALGASSRSVTAAAKRHVKGPTFTVSFPAAGQTSVTLETISIKVPKGATVKSLSIKPEHASQLPSQVAIAGAVTPKSTHGRKATFQIYVFMHTFPGGPQRRAHEGPVVSEDIGTNFIEALARYIPATSKIKAFDHGIQDCSLAWAAGFYGDGVWSKAAWRSLQNSLNQPSPPESVIDDIVYKACAGQAEGPKNEQPEQYDPGDG